jgi:hypothetical protein
MDIEFEDLILKVFNNKPQLPKSYMVSFDVTDLKNLYEILIEFFYKGMSIKYGEGLNNLTEERFQEMNKYMASIGIRVYYEPHETFDFMHNFKIYKEIESNKLEDYKYYFVIQGRYYIIYFSLL